MLPIQAPPPRRPVPRPLVPVTFHAAICHIGANIWISIKDIRGFGSHNLQTDRWHPATRPLPLLFRSHNRNPHNYRDLQLHGHCYGFLSIAATDHYQNLHHHRESGRLSGHRVELSIFSATGNSGELICIPALNIGRRNPRLLLPRWRFLAARTHPLSVRLHIWNPFLCRLLLLHCQGHRLLSVTAAYLHQNLHHHRESGRLSGHRVELSIFSATGNSGELICIPALNIGR